MDNEVEFRPVEPSEIGFVLDSWIKSYRQSDWAGVVPNHLFFSVMRETIGGLIARGAKLVGASVAGRLLGYVCYEHKGEDTAVLHYVYVKDPFRRKGLGKRLVSMAVGDRENCLYTARTRHSKFVARGAYAPEVARRKVL